MSNTPTSCSPDLATSSDLWTEFVSGNSKAAGTTAKPIGVLGWYRILRVHYQWPFFQAIRYALWLAR